MVSQYSAILGLGGFEKDATMHIENLVILNESNGFRYIEFLEDPTKARRGEFLPKQRSANLKMFVVVVKRCLVRLVKVYLFKRRNDQKNCGRL